MSPENNIENNSNAESAHVSTINIEVSPTPAQVPQTAAQTAAPLAPMAPMTVITMPISSPSMSTTVNIDIPTMDMTPMVGSADAAGTTEAGAAEVEAAVAAEAAAATAEAAKLQVEAEEAAAIAAHVVAAEIAAAVATAEQVAAVEAVASLPGPDELAATAAKAAAIAAREINEKNNIAKVMNLNANLQLNGENNGNVATQMSVESAVAAATAISEQQQQQQQQQHEIRNESQKGKMDTDPTLANFKVLYVLTQLCGLTMILLVGSWVGVHMGGLSGPSNPKLEFNWHPLLMTIGLIFLYGNSILVYRGFRNIRKKTLKISHASIHMTAFILTVIALKTVFDSHNLAETPIPNMYSLHSWLGLSAVLLFCLQYVAGFVSYMVPGLKETYKIAYMPFHIYFGLFGFVLAVASALMGLTEKAIFSIDKYSDLPSSGVTANMCGIIYVIFGGLVVYLATEPAYKRKPIPEDAILLTGANE